MNTCFDFEQYEPPAVDVNFLKFKRQHRILIIQTVLLIIGTVFTNLCFVMLSLLVCKDSLILSTLIIIYLCISTILLGIIIYLFFHEKEVPLWLYL